MGNVIWYASWASGNIHCSRDVEPGFLATLKVPLFKSEKLLCFKIILVRREASVFRESFREIVVMSSSNLTLTAL